MCLVRGRSGRQWGVSWGNTCCGRRQWKLMIKPWTVSSVISLPNFASEDILRASSPTSPASSIASASRVRFHAVLSIFTGCTMPRKRCNQIHLYAQILCHIVNILNTHSVQACLNNSCSCAVYHSVIIVIVQLEGKKACNHVLMRNDALLILRNDINSYTEALL